MHSAAARCASSLRGGAVCNTTWQRWQVYHPQPVVVRAQSNMPPGVAQHASRIHEWQKRPIMAPSVKSRHYAPDVAQEVRPIIQQQLLPLRHLQKIRWHPTPRHEGALSSRSEPAAAAMSAHIHAERACVELARPCRGHAGHSSAHRCGCDQEHMYGARSNVLRFHAARKQCQAQRLCSARQHRQARLQCTTGGNQSRAAAAIAQRQSRAGVRESSSVILCGQAQRTMLCWARAARLRGYSQSAAHSFWTRLQQE